MIITYWGRNSRIKPLLQYTNVLLQNFLYALKAPDSKRHYPLRLEYFFDYLGSTGTLKEKCLIFLWTSKKKSLYGLHQLMPYLKKKCSSFELIVVVIF